MGKIILTIPVIVLILFSCDKSTANKAGDLTISKVAYSGCFLNQNQSQKSVSGQNVDSLYYEISDSILSLNADLIYNCCGSLRDSSVIQNCTVNIYIHDNCLENCICKCNCLFKFKYSIVGYRQKTTYFKVYIKRNTDKNYSIWKEIKYSDI
jgi:hypothetical protein